MKTDPAKGILKRVTLKLSTGLSEDEIRRAIAQAMGIPLEKVPQVDFQSAKAKIKNEILEVENIISEYKNLLQRSANLPQDKYEELYDLGRFILAFNQSIEILIPETIQKFPDFKIKEGNKIIGIEHTRLINEKVKATIKAAKYFIANAQKLIAQEFNHLSKTVNIFIDYNEIVIGQKNFKTRKFSPDEKVKIAIIIADYIKSLLTTGNAARPSFIRHVEVSSNQDSRIDFELAENYFTKNEFTELLLERIDAKERRVNSYRKAVNSNEIWLVIVADDINSFSGFDMQRATFPKIEASNFDKLILFEKFGGKIYTLFAKEVDET